MRYSAGQAGEMPRWLGGVAGCRPGGLSIRWSYRIAGVRTPSDASRHLPPAGGNGAAGIALFRSRALILVGGMCWREVCGFGGGGKEKRDPRYPGVCRVSPRGWPSVSTCRCRQALAAYPETRASSPCRLLLGLAPDEACHATDCYQRTGGLLHRRFTLTRLRGRSVLCCAISQVTLGGRYPPSCSAEPGSSSALPNE